MRPNPTTKTASAKPRRWFDDEPVRGKLPLPFPVATVCSPTLIVVGVVVAGTVDDAVVVEPLLCSATVVDVVLVESSGVVVDVVVEVEVLDVEVDDVDVDVDELVVDVDVVDEVGGVVVDVVVVDVLVVEVEVDVDVVVRGALVDVVDEYGVDVEVVELGVPVTQTVLVSRLLSSRPSDLLATVADTNTSPTRFGVKVSSSAVRSSPGFNRPS